MNRVIAKDRWLIWTIVFAVAISMMLVSYSNFAIGDLDQITATILL